MNAVTMVMLMHTMYIDVHVQITFLLLCEHKRRIIISTYLLKLQLKSLSFDVSRPWLGCHDRLELRTEVIRTQVEKEKLDPAP